jgi:integral membrane sensor domain MASE1
MASILESIRVPPSEKLLQLSDTAVFFVTVFAYLILAQISAYLYNPVTNGGTFWPGAGLSLGLLVMLPTRQWLWVILAVAVAEFGGNQIHANPLAANLFWTCGNCIEPLIGATLIRRAGNLTGSLSPQGNLMRFLAYGVL